MYMNIWSPVGATIWGDLKLLGGRVLLKERLMAVGFEDLQPCTVLRPDFTPVSCM